MKTIQKTAVYVKINENYTATIYNLSDFESYCKAEKIDPASLEVNASYTVRGTEFSRNENLATEVEAWISSHYPKPVYKISGYAPIIGDTMNFGVHVYKYGKKTWTIDLENCISERYAKLHIIQKRFGRKKDAVNYLKQLAGNFA